MSWTNVGAAAVDVAGDIVGFNRSREASSKEAKRNRLFQLYMSNTAYQRAAADLDKAGLNRVLALGSPASTPSGAMFTAPKLDLDPIAAASAAQAIKQQKAQTKFLEEQEKLAKDQQDKTKAETEFTKQATREKDAFADKAEFEKVLYEKLQPKVDAIIEGLMPQVSGATDAITSGVKTLEKIRSVQKDVYNKIMEASDGSVEKAAKFVEERWNLIKEWWKK